MWCLCAQTLEDARNGAKGALRFAGRTARAMIGQPDYEAYVAHVRQTHPDEQVMSREAFFLNRQDRRFGGGPDAVFKCC